MYRFYPVILTSEAEERLIDQIDRGGHGILVAPKMWAEGIFDHLMQRRADGSAELKLHPSLIYTRGKDVSVTCITKVDQVHGMRVDFIVVLERTVREDGDLDRLAMCLR